MASATIDWNTATSASALVPVTLSTPSGPFGTSIHLSVSGPSRAESDTHTPAVILEPCLGISWAAVVRDLVGSPSSSSASSAPAQGASKASQRVYTYAHTGIGESRDSPKPPRDRSASALAAELVALLKAAKIRPPFVLAGQSYGGVLVREFVAQAQEEWASPDVVVGLVLVDANCHRAMERPASEAYLESWLVRGQIDYAETVGLNANHKLTPEEWRANKAQDMATDTRGEMRAYRASCEALGRRNQYEARVLGDHAVSVIKGSTYGDVMKLYQLLEARKIGSAAELAEFRGKMEAYRVVDEQFQRDQLRLSSVGRVTRAERSGHNIQYTEPEVIADEVRWVVGEWEKKREGGGGAGKGDGVAKKEAEKSV